MEYRSIGKGFSTTLDYYVNNDVTITVGPNEPFKTINSAINSISSSVVTGNILIKVLDGVYTEPTIFLDNSNLSSRLTIEGNLTNPLNCTINFIPDPNIGTKLLSAYNFSSKGTGIPDFSKIGSGIVATNGFTLRLGGFLLNGGVISNDPDTIVIAGLAAVNGSTILCKEGSIKITNFLLAAVAKYSSRIICNNLECFNIIGTGLSATQNSLICSKYSNFHSNNFGQIPILSTAYLNRINAGNTILGNFYSENIAPSLASIPFYASFGSYLECNYSTFSDYQEGGISYCNSYVHVRNGTFSNISNKYCFLATLNSSIYADYCTFKNVFLPLVTLNSSVIISYPAAMTNVAAVTIGYKGTLIAIGASSLISTTLFTNGTASGAKDANGNLYIY